MNKSFISKKYFLKARAFSMIELAVFITVISFVLVAVALNITAKTQNNKSLITRSNIKEVYKALGTFVAKNSRLPCPARINDVLSDSTFGAEGISSGECDTNSGSYFTSGNLIYGMVPVKALALPLDYVVDGYGSKLVYVVNKRFAEDATYESAFTSESGAIVIKNYVLGSESTLTSDAIFVIISYGKNKRGAFNFNSPTQIANSSDTDEIDNSASALDNDFINFSERAGGSFDDIIFYRNNKNDFLQDFEIGNLVSPNTTESNE